MPNRKAIYFSFFIFHFSFLLLLTGCQGKRGMFTLKGDIPTLGNDTVLVYGGDEWFDHIDTVVARHGRFRFSFVPDTVTPLWIAFPGGHREMFFAEKGTETTLMGDTACDGHLILQGGTQNDLLAEFDALTRDTVLSLHQTQLLVDSFIGAHPYDEASIALLQKWYVRIAEPSPTQVRGITNKMSGNLQDNNAIVDLRSRLGLAKNRANVLTLTNYSLQDPDGKSLNTNTCRDTVLLINFWASWCEESRRDNEEYRALIDSFAGRPFAVLGVSLDNDRDTWLRTIKEDSLTWLQGNGFEGWDLDMLKMLGVDHLPSNALLNPQRRSQDFDLHGEALIRRIDDLVTREEERVKAAEKAAKEQAAKDKKKKKLTTPKKK